MVCRKTTQRRAEEDARLELEIIAAHKRTRETCGSKRLREDLPAHGVDAGLYRIRKLRKKLGIHCKQKKKLKATTDSSHKLPVADNLLEQKFETTEPNRVWVSDITYIPTDEGRLYLAGHKDICTGELVGHAMSERMTRKPVLRA